MSCHGDKAQGNLENKAPKLTGLEGWYTLQIPEKIKNKERKAHPLIGKSLPTKEYEEIIKYIENLK